MSTISVIIPAFNVEKYIKKTIESVIKQSYKNYEIIIVNDGSTDKTLNICNELAECYKDQVNIRIIDSINKGVSNARNLGINKALGKYIFFLDSDDIIDENLFKTLMCEIEDNDLAFVPFDIISEGRVQMYESKYNIEFETIDNVSLLENIMLNNIGLSAISVLYKSDIIKNNNIKFTLGCINGEDQEFYMKYICHIKKAKYINGARSYYIQRRMSISNTYNSKKFGAIDAIDRVINYKYFPKKYIKRFILENKYKNELFTNINSMIKFSKCEYSEYRKIIRKYDYILKYGFYSVDKLNIKELIWASRYNLFRINNKLYFIIMKNLYRKKGD